MCGGEVCASVHCMYGCRWRLAASTGDTGLIMELQDHRGCLLFLKGVGVGVGVVAALLCSVETDMRRVHKDQ